MTTAVDKNVLLDIFLPDKAFAKDLSAWAFDETIEVETASSIIKEMDSGLSDDGGGIEKRNRDREI